ncbi:putative SOS response-associated peptidase YedK [Pseudarthrobacter sp. SLBN-100]|uniref:SOS response-associated peptidase family protein n=1 Tax=Arthrobacter sp. SLBN-100 TaxID=2768450 RepID=UPI002E107E5D
MPSQVDIQPPRTPWATSMTAPVIIPRDRFAEWLDPDLTDKNDIQHLLDSLPEPTLTPRIVSPRVNSVRNNGPELIEPAEPAGK